MTERSRAFQSFSPYPDKGERLTLELTAEDALNVYKALNGYRFNDGRVDRLVHLIELNYEVAVGERLTEPWEWED